MKIAVALGIIASLMLPVAGMAAENLGTIQGQVRNHNGAPVVGALVIAVATKSFPRERMAFTDSLGAFSIPNLLVGQYSVKVTMSPYLPTQSAAIQLSGGTTAILSLNLQTAMDVVRRVNTRDAKSGQDMVWILRSSRATQPVLRLLGEGTEDDVSGADYSGYLQIYSNSFESNRGVTDGLGSRFSLTLPLQSHARVIVDGQYNESPDQPRGLAATYEFAPVENRQSRVSVNVRQATVLNGSFPEEDLKEIQLKYDEKLELLNHFVFNYGAETGRTDGMTSEQYIRPMLGVSFVPNAITTIGVVASAEGPAQADDPIRGKDYFEQKTYLPSVHQEYRHAEVHVTRILDGATKLSGAVFKDRAASQTLFVSLPDGTRTFLILDGSNLRSQGARFFVDREFKGFNAGLGYTVASGFGLSKPAYHLDELMNQMTHRQFHVVTARVKTDVDITNTELTAVYHWVSPLAAVTIDPYQTNAEYLDPTLSITVAQNLPTWGTFPGKVQAILDARNLLESSNPNHGIHISNSPRFVKGGINIRF
jgi:hypothetical protein